MKKLLIILMVVAMASFLFVGCLSGVAPDIDDEDEDEVPAPTSTTPTILDIQDSDEASIVDLTSTKTQYINKTEAGTSILVKGIASSKALVQVYIGSATTPVAVGAAATTGLFSIAVAETALGADSLVAKTLHATSTELGLAESLASNVATFILDTDLPGIDSVAFTADEAAVDVATAEFEVTASNDVLVIGDTDPLDVTVTCPAGTETEVVVLTVELSGTENPVQTFEAGYWVISFLSYLGEEDNILVTSPSGEEKFYTISLEPTVIIDYMIPGIKLTLIYNWTDAVDAIENITIEISEVDAATDAIAGRATLKFDEDVSYAAATATTCVYSGAVDADPYAYKETNNTGYWTELTITQAAPYTITVYGVKDLAGNVGGTEAVPLTKSATAGAASETDLEP